MDLFVNLSPDGRPASGRHRRNTSTTPGQASSDAASDAGQGPTSTVAYWAASIRIFLSRQLWRGDDPEAPPGASS